jgi:hypothetical protein
VSKKNKLKNFTKAGMGLGNAFDIELNNIDLSDTLDNIQGISGSKYLFLGRFNENDLLTVIESIGLKKHLSSMGFNDIIADIYKDENYINYFRLYSNEKTPQNQLIDLRVSENTFIPDKKFINREEDSIPYDMITIEWLSAKNPNKPFDGEKPQLPGQTNPGLGVLKYCFQLLYIIAKDVYKDGFLDIPDHMHGAIMYSKKFKFFDPVHEGILRAVMRDLKKYSLAEISWGVITETIIDKDKNEPAVYDPCEQIHYVSNRMRKYFKSKKYKDTFKKYYNRKHYYLDYNEMLRRKEEILKIKAIEDL